MSIKTLEQIDISSKTVLVRVDYNVPYDNEMHITDYTRITSTFQTLNYCLDRGCKLIIISHMGRPKGKVVPELTLKPVAATLAKLLNRDVRFIETPIGEKLKKQIQAMKSGDIFLLENIRFYPGEETNDDEFAKHLASLADVYVNDAFAAAHNAHASNCAVTKYIKACAAGFLLANEIRYFAQAMAGARQPLCAIIGGAKVSTKLKAILNIMPHVDSIIIGGGMAFTFLKAKGYNVGKSIMEEELVEAAATTLALAEIHKKNLLLPVDIIAVKKFDNDAPRTLVRADEMSDDQIGVDIGPETIEIFSKTIKEAGTNILNGPMGVFEMPNFAKGTNAVLEALADSDCLSIVGGGDSVTAIRAAGVEDRISYLSTGGGAFLKLLEGSALPAVAALEAR